MCKYTDSQSTVLYLKCSTDCVYWECSWPVSNAVSNLLLLSLILHLNSIPETLNYHFQLWSQPICPSSYLLLCPHMHHNNPIITLLTCKYTDSQSTVLYLKSSTDCVHWGMFMPIGKCGEQLAPLITKPTPQFLSQNAQLSLPIFPSTDMSPME